MQIQSSIQHILFPTDFSDLSSHAQTIASEISKKHSATLHLLHVIDLPFAAALSAEHTSKVYADLEVTALEVLNRVADFLAVEYGLTTKVHLHSGNPAQVIVEKAAQLDCGLIVMGTHGASGFREFFMGTTAYAVIKNSEIPVLTVPDGKTIKKFGTIIFPIRATSGIMDKYDFTDLFIKENTTRFIIVCLSKQGESFEHNYLEEKLRQLTWKLGENGVVFTTIFKTSEHYAQEVLQIAQNEKADLIVINATLDYKWNRFFIGPYTQQVVNHATVPVLSIREKGPAADPAGLVEAAQDRKERLAF